MILELGVDGTPKEWDETNNVTIPNEAIQPVDIPPIEDLNIADEYEYMNENLIAEIENGMKYIFKKCAEEQIKLTKDVLNFTRTSLMHPWELRDQIIQILILLR